MPRLSPAAARAVHRALEKEPQDRFASVDDLADALRSAAGLAADFGRTTAPSSHPGPALELGAIGPALPSPVGPGSGVVPRAALGASGDAPTQAMGVNGSLSSPMPRERWHWALPIATVVALGFLTWLLRGGDAEPRDHHVAPSSAFPKKPPVAPAPNGIVPRGSTAERSPERTPEEVDVNVHTDVEGATLLVNGESKGEISPELSKTLKLRPGAYRFEAQRAGSPTVVSVVTLRADTPMDVFLELPKGLSENSTAAAPGKAGSVPGQGSRTARPAPKPAMPDNPF